MENSESAIPPNSSQKASAAIHDVLDMMHGRSPDLSPLYEGMALSLGWGVMRLIKDNQEGDVTPFADKVIMWLGQWRDSLPTQAVDDLQKLCQDAISSQA